MNHGLKTRATMNIDIETLDDLRVAPYRHLKDRDLRADGDRFVAEGRKIVERLLASRYAVESILCDERHAEAFADRDLPVYVTGDVSAIVGFPFHQGCLAVGRAGPLQTIDRLVATLGERATLVIADESNNVENLGSILRIAAGFGASGVILGPRSADVFYRRCIRVSMGTIFLMPLAQSADLSADLALLASRGFDTVATVTDADAIPLPALAIGPRRAIVLGSEAQGLSRDLAAACTHRATIPMHLGTDSLNVSIAAAVFLYHLSTR